MSNWTSYKLVRKLSDAELNAALAMGAEDLKDFVYAGDNWPNTKVGGTIYRLGRTFIQGKGESAWLFEDKRKEGLLWNR